MKFTAQKKHKAKPAPVVSTHTTCPCGGDHSRAKGEEKLAPTEEIIAASEEAQASTDEWKLILKGWVARLTAAAGKLGVKLTKLFFQELNARLETLKRDELTMQMRANATVPRDPEGGIHHGWLRGRYEEAQYRIGRADAHIKEPEGQEAERKAKKAGQADAEAPGIALSGGIICLTAGKLTTCVAGRPRPLIDCPATT
jgi:hypothetical protein